VHGQYHFEPGESPDLIGGSEHCVYHQPVGTFGKLGHNGELDRGRGVSGQSAQDPLDLGDDAFEDLLGVLELAVPGDPEPHAEGDLALGAGAFLSRRFPARAPPSGQDCASTRSSCCSV
jgi:hypothetical protein